MLTHELQTNLDLIFLLRKKYSWNMVHSIWIALVTINSNASSIAAYVIWLYWKCIYKQLCNKFVVIMGQKIFLHIQFSLVIGNSTPLPCPPPHYFHATTSTLKLAGVHHLDAMTNGQLFYRSLILTCIIQILTCICLAISLKRLFSCWDTHQVKPILNKHLQNVWQTCNTHCQMFVQCEWCVCCDINFIPLITCWHFNCTSSVKSLVCYSTVPFMLSWVTMISL